MTLVAYATSFAKPVVAVLAERILNTRKKI